MPEHGLSGPDFASDAVQTRYIVFGDLHGRPQLLDGLVEIYGSQENIQFVSNGDAINKGEGSKQVVQRLLDIGATCLMGNHEWLVLRAMNEKNEDEKARFVSVNFARYFADICSSYGVVKKVVSEIKPKKAIKIIDDLAEEIGTVGHSDYFESLRLYLDTGKLLILHAGVKVDHSWDGESGQKEYLNRVALSIEKQDCDWHGISYQIMDGKDFPLAKKLIIPKGLDRTVITGHHHSNDRKKARITHGGKRVRLGGPKGDKGPLYAYDSKLRQVVEIAL